MEMSGGNVDEFDPRMRESEVGRIGRSNIARRIGSEQQDQRSHVQDVMNDAIMSTALVRNVRDAKLEVSLGESRYGTPQPQIEVRFPRGTEERKTQAALHTILAIAELATASSEQWTVGVDTHRYGSESGRVYVELAEGDPREVSEAMALLERVVRER
jgi:hypothetical protein